MDFKKELDEYLKTKELVHIALMSGTPYEIFLESPEEEIRKFVKC